MIEYPGDIPFNGDEPAPAPRGYEGRGRRFQALPGASRPAQSFPEDLPANEFASAARMPVPEPPLPAPGDEMVEALSYSRAGQIVWKALPKPALRSVNPRGVELPHPDVFMAKLPGGRNVRVWQRRTPDVSAGAMVRRILGSGNDENWVTTVGVEIHDAEGMLTYRLTGLRGQPKFRDVVELFDQAAGHQSAPPAPPAPAPTAPAPLARAEPEPPAPPPVPAAIPRPQPEIFTQMEAIPAMPSSMPMPPPPMTKMEPSYWQQERAELIEELAMWRRECMAARVALDEMRKLINGTRPKSGSRLFKRDRKDPPLTRTY